MAAIPVIILIGIIYLMMLLLKRWKKLTQPETNQFPLIEFVGMWVLIFFGIVDSPNISQTNAIVYIILDTVAVSLFGVLYYYWRQPRRSKPSFIQRHILEPTEPLSAETNIVTKETKWQRVTFWGIFITELCEAVAALIHSREFSLTDSVGS